MKVIKYDKLIRDNIPEMIKASGKECEVSVLDNEHFIKKLKEKLLEETQEVISASENDLVAELADVLEVLEAIESYYGIEHRTVENIKHHKALKNGKFSKKLVLLETRETD